MLRRKKGEDHARDNHKDCPDRVRARLHLLVTDDSGIVVFESGKPGGDGGTVGNDADEGLATWEQHYDTIHSQEEVQIYEPIMLTYEGEVTFTLLRAFEYAKDNRLLPDGFNKHNAPGVFAVYGDALGDTDSVGGSDRVVYELDIAAVTGTLHVTAELLLQTLSYPFVGDLNVNPTQLVDRFMKMYDPAAN